MAWSADNDYRTRVMSRRRSTVQLRHPAAGYGLSALVLLYAIGFVTTLWLASGFSAVDDANALLAPAGVATVATALGVGLRLLRYEESSAASIVLRVGMIWAAIGAAWQLWLTAVELFAAPMHAIGLPQLASAAVALLMHTAGSAFVGGAGGIAGGAAATFLCVERAR